MPGTVRARCVPLGRSSEVIQFSRCIMTLPRFFRTIEEQECYHKDWSQRFDSFRFLEEDGGDEHRILEKTEIVLAAAPWTSCARSAW